MNNALKYFQQVQVIDKEIGYKQGEAIALANIGFIYSDKGDLNNALTYLQQAKEIFSKIEAKPQLQVVQQAIPCVKDKKLRRGRNPATGEDMMLRPRRIVTFKCSGLLRDKVNE